MYKFCVNCMEQFEESYGICPACGYVDGTALEDDMHMEPSSILRERYIVGRALGFGGFGVTYIGWDATLQQKVAIKEYLPSEFSTRVPGQTQITVFSGDKAEQFQDGLVKFVDEAQRLAKFHQEGGVVRIFDSFEANNTAYIVMEYLQGETLAQYLKREKTVSVDKAIDLLMPVIHSLESIHGRGIIHRDIAPDNIFLTNDGKIKLIDFGAARFATTSHSRSLTVIIKPGYSPEEQYRSRGDQGSYTDVYAIGATLYRMITGIVPPDALERRATFESKKKDILKPIGRYVKDISENHENAIFNAINIRIEDRTPDMETFAKELTTQKPEKVKRLHGKIKKIDLLKWPLWAKIGAPAAMLAVITLSALFALGIIGFNAQLQDEIYIPDGWSRVPSIISNDLVQAEERLNLATLLHTITGREYSDRVPADLILTQDISPGSIVLARTIVEVTISGGIEIELDPEIVPDFQFRTEAEARQIIEDMGLIADVLFSSSETVASGLVISQEPIAGTLSADVERISITISTGSPPFDMPNVVGMTEHEALFVLGESALSVSVEFENNDSIPAGNVIRQSIHPNAEVRRGDVVIITVSSREELVQVANVVGESQSTATSILRGQGFTVAVNEVASETVPRGNVLSQSLVAGSAQVAGTQIILTISTGAPIVDIPIDIAAPTGNDMLNVTVPPNLPIGEASTPTPPPTPTPTPTDAPESAQINVPNLENRTESAAVTAIQNAGLIVGTVTRQQHETIAEGRVISQSPAANTSVDRGGVVNIVVSSGRETVTVPNLENQTEASAQTRIQNAGLVVGNITHRHHETIAEGRVISQTPAANTSVGRGSSVNLVISTGRGTVNVPNVANQTETAAETAIQNAGLAVGNISRQHHDTIAEGRVISQTPIANTSVNRGSTVNLVISSGRETVNVPNVENQTEAAAETAIQNAGLVVGNISRQHHDTIVEGRVISQTPTANTSVNRGSTVNLVISMGRQQVNVPNVSGMSRSAAENAIQNVGLVPSVTEQHHDTIANGQLISQTPIANTLVNLGSTVNLVFSRGINEIPPSNISAPDGGEVGVPYDATLTASGTAPFTWSVSAGSLPDGLSLNANTGRITGTPTVAGIFTLTFRAENAAGYTTRSITIGILGEPPTILTNMIPPSQVGATFNRTLEARGPTPITWRITEGSLPPGLDLDTNTGVISGTPTMAGDFVFTVRAENPAGHTPRQFTITIVPAAPATPRITTQGQLFNVNHGDTITVSVTVTMPTEYVSGSRKYVLWGAFSAVPGNVPGNWIEVGGNTFLHGGTTTVDFVINTSGLDMDIVRNTGNNFAFGLFEADRFYTGASLMSHFVAVRIATN